MTIKDEKVYILESFNDIVKNYYIYNNFSTDYEFLDIPLNIHIIYYNINFTDENKYDNIACQIFYSNNYGQYQMTKILELPYYKGRDIYYNAMHFDSISSLFDFYAYIFIANELDTYGIFLGDSYYNQAFELTKMGIESNNYEQWQLNSDLIKQVKENTYLRNAKYYYFKAYDIYNNDELKEIDLEPPLKDLLSNLNNIYKKYGYDKSTLKFLDAFKTELALLFSISLKEGLEFLKSYDSKNIETYQQYIHE